MIITCTCFIIFSVLINDVILLLDCLVLIHLSLHTFSFSWVLFFCLNIIWSFIYPDLCTVSLLPYIMVLKTICPDYGAQASLMLFYEI